METARNTSRGRAVSAAEDNLPASLRQPLPLITTVFSSTLTAATTADSASPTTMPPSTRKRRASVGSNDLTPTLSETPAIDPRILDAPTAATEPQALPVPKRQRLRKSALPTPPTTPVKKAAKTMKLKLTIPEAKLTRTEENKIKRREACARKWKSKLQRPYPSKKELADSYNLKLMRHYPKPFTPKDPNFIIPPIDRSPRVDKLRRHFPVAPPLSTGINITKPYSATATHRAPTSDEQERQEAMLEANKRITNSEEAQRLAWQCFSTKEDRRDNGREAMMLSALWEDDLDREDRGLPNKLPGWRKTFTSRFAKE